MVTGETKSNFLLTKKFSFLFIITFLFVIVVVFVFSSNWEKKTKIKKLYIEGLVYSDSEAIESLVWKKLSESRDILDLKQTLELLTFVKSCNIFHIDNETLGVQLTERRPIAKIEEKNNRYTFLDETGMLFTFITKKKISVPVILCPEVTEGKNLYSNNLINFLLKLKNANISRFVSEIRENSDCFRIFTKSSRTQMIFAKPIRDDEITKAANFLSKIETNDLMNSNEIDFRIEGQVIIR
jgi:hypothetical protein